MFLLFHNHPQTFVLIFGGSLACLAWQLIKEQGIIGPLQFMITWYKTAMLESKLPTGTSKLLCFGCLTGQFALQHGGFVPCDRKLQRAYLYAHYLSLSSINLEAWQWIKELEIVYMHKA